MKATRRKVGNKVPCDSDILILLLAWRKKVQMPPKAVALPEPAIGNQILNFKTKTIGLHSCIMLTLLMFPNDLAKIKATLMFGFAFISSHFER